MWLQVGWTVFFIIKLIFGMLLPELMVKEAGGVVNNINDFHINNIVIKASSGSINDKLLENIRNF